MNQPTAQASTATDAIIVTAICFGWFILGSVQAVASGFPAHPFSDSTFFSIIILELILGASALGYLQVRGHNLTQLVPIPTAIGCLVGLALYASAIFITWPLELAFGPSHSNNQPIDLMVANATISFAPLLGMSIVNGIYEEVFLIAYLQRNMESYGAAFAVGVSLLVRVLYHLYQGPIGAMSALGFGLVVSVYFLWRRKLWPIVFAHIFADIAGFSLS